MFRNSYHTEWMWYFQEVAKRSVSIPYPNATLYASYLLLPFEGMNTLHSHTQFDKVDLIAFSMLSMCKMAENVMRYTCQFTTK